MNRFEFAQPASLDETLALLGASHADTEVLAGGTDLLSLMKDFVVEPKRLVSLQRVPELRGIEVTADAVRLGAMTTLDELLGNAAIAARFPVLVQAAQGIRGPQMRAMGTLGGELLQRPRCWYFRRGYGLLAAKDGTSMVEVGDHRHHAILGNQSLAKYVHASSLAPALCALNAAVEIVGKNGAAGTR
jgi:xanthine dehydrogenase YagS FAD-binding subunit